MSVQFAEPGGPCREMLAEAGSLAEIQDTATAAAVEIDKQKAGFMYGTLRHGIIYFLH